MTNVKLNALADFLGELRDDWEETSYDKNRRFESGNREYLVLTDEEADDAVKEYIKESVWAFRPEFIASHTANGLNMQATAALAKMQGELCESANDLVLALIDDFDGFVDDAVQADGRGHFLSSYDSEENEYCGEDGEMYYIYRVN